MSERATFYMSTWRETPLWGLSTNILKTQLSQWLCGLFSAPGVFILMLLFGPDRVLRTRSAWVYHGRLPAPPRQSLLVLLKLLPEMGKTSAPQPQNAQTALLWLEFSLVYIAGCLMFRKKKAPHLSSLPRSPCLPVPLPLFLCLCLYFCCPEGGLVSCYVGCLSSDRAAKGLVKCLYKKKHDSLLVTHIVFKSQWGCFFPTETFSAGAKVVHLRCCSALWFKPWFYFYLPRRLQYSWMNINRFRIYFEESL